MKGNALKRVLAITVVFTIMMPIPVMAGEEKQATEQDFLKDLKTGLEKRWKISDESGDTASMSSDEVVEFDTNVVNAEYEMLEKYKDCTFDNIKFTMLADAYIKALETQMDAIGYYKDSNSIYNQFWSAGYNVRSIVVPDLIDYYGLQIDNQSSVDEFRNNKALLESDGTTYTVTTTDTTTSSDTAASTDSVNMGNQQVQQPIEVYNDDGVKITITGYQKIQSNYAQLTMSVVNLYHKDLTIGSPDYTITVNGMSVNAAPYGEIQTGKTGEATLDLYDTQLNGITIDDITSIDFKLALYVKDSYQLKAQSGDIYLSVNDGVVTQRVVYTDKENIQKVQQLLTNLGYNAGGTDGVPGKLTNSAILQFEQEHGLAENTDITPELIAELEKAAQ